MAHALSYRALATAIQGLPEGHDRSCWESLFGVALRRTTRECLAWADDILIDVPKPWLREGADTYQPAGNNRQRALAWNVWRSRSRSRSPDTRPRWTNRVGAWDNNPQY
jgi:hypothetical protein